MGSGSYPPSIFVLGTDRDIGKTVTCMAIICKLLSEKHGYRIDDIGYIKPVGQQTLSVTREDGSIIEADKDAVLVTSLLGVSSYGYDNMSPVLWRGGVTAAYIDEALSGDPLIGRDRFIQRIRDAYTCVAQGKKAVIVEGTGQPGVGSVAGVSNADVINALREMGVPVFVIMVTEGGIGSTIDQVFPYLMALDHMGTAVDGLLINDVMVDRLDKIKHYLHAYYERVFPTLYGKYLKTNHAAPPLLGFVPTIPELRLPTMRLIAEHFAKDSKSGLEIIAPKDFEAGACRLVHDVKVISLDFGYEPYLQPGNTVIVGVNANDVILAILLLHERMMRRTKEGLSGLILSCKNVGGLSPEIRNLIQAGSLATLALDYDSAEIIQRVEGETWKIQPYDAAKKELIGRTCDEHLTLWPEFGGRG